MFLLKLILRKLLGLGLIVLVAILCSLAASRIDQPAAADRDAEHERQHTASRSSQWPKVRAAHLAAHPVCEACGSKGSKRKPLQVHHIIPFRVAGQADADGDGLSNELDPDNLITLCIDGVGHCDCHLLIGHAGNFKCHNDNVVRDAKRFREMLAGQTCDPK